MEKIGFATTGEFGTIVRKTQQLCVRHKTKTLATLLLLLGRRSQERKKSFSSLLLAELFGIIEKNSSVLELPKPNTPRA